MECHKCQHNGKRSDVCIKCRDNGTLSNHGKTFVSIDAPADHDSVLVKGKRVATGGRTPNLNVNDCCEDAVRRLLASLLQLSDEEVLLVLCIARGDSLSAFARSRGISRQAIHAKMMNITRHYSEFRCLLARVRFSVGAGDAETVKHEEAEEQMELFGSILQA